MGRPGETAGGSLPSTFPISAMDETPEDRPDATSRTPEGEAPSGVSSEWSAPGAGAAEGEAGQTERDQTDGDAPDDRSTARRAMVLAVGVIAFALLVVVAFLVAGGESSEEVGSDGSDEVAESGSSDPEVNLGIGNQEPGPAPDFDLEDFEEEAVSLEDFRGKPLVLNFWASWCTPCRKEMPAFDEVYRGLDGQVAFLGIATQDQRKPAEDFAREVGVSYPLAFDEGDKVGDAYELFGMPSTYFVDEDGQIVEARFGELTSGELEEIIGTLFPDVEQG